MSKCLSSPLIIKAIVQRSWDRVQGHDIVCLSNTVAAGKNIQLTYLCRFSNEHTHAHTTTPSGSPSHIIASWFLSRDDKTWVPPRLKSTRGYRPKPWTGDKTKFLQSSNIKLIYVTLFITLTKFCSNKIVLYYFSHRVLRVVWQVLRLCSWNVSCWRDKYTH